MGGVAGLSIASRLAEAGPGTIVLAAAIELFTLSFRLDEPTKANIVATALFGDGAAAYLLRTIETGIAEIEMSGQLSWPGTLDILAGPSIRSGWA